MRNRNLVVGLLVLSAFGGILAFGLLNGSFLASETGGSNLNTVPPQILNDNKSEISAQSLGSCSNNVVYVDIGGDDSRSGQSWLEAKKTIQAAINLVDNVNIWVKQGTYKEHLTSADRSFCLYGGFAGDETKIEDRHGQATIIDGQNTDRILNASNTTATPQIVIDTVTAIQGKIDQGQISDGGAIRIFKGNATLNKVTISDSFAKRNGGCLYLASTLNNSLTDLTLKNCSAQTAGGGLGLASISNLQASRLNLSNNWAILAGGGLMAETGLNATVNDGLITNSVFENNYTGPAVIDKINGDISKGRGGAVYINGARYLSFSQNVFRSNTAAGLGSAFYIENNSALIANNLIYHNRAVGNSTIVLSRQTSTPRFVNNTISDNQDGDKTRPNYGYSNPATVLLAKDATGYFIDNIFSYQNNNQYVFNFNEATVKNFSASSCKNNNFYPASVAVTPTGTEAVDGELYDYCRVNKNSNISGQPGFLNRQNACLKDSSLNPQLEAGAACPKSLLTSELNYNIDPYPDPAQPTLLNANINKGTTSIPSTYPYPADDFLNSSRVVNSLPDIGAFEFAGISQHLVLPGYVGEKPARLKVKAKDLTSGRLVYEAFVPVSETTQFYSLAERTKLFDIGQGPFDILISVDRPILSNGLEIVPADITPVIRSYMAKKYSNLTFTSANSPGSDIALIGGDISLDDAVNLYDLNSVLSKFGQRDSSFDVDGDGLVTLPDLSLILINFNLSADTL